MAYLIDSNIIIYSYLIEYQYLKGLIITEPSFVSEISRVKVLGYHKLKKDEEICFKDIFGLISILPTSKEIFDKAIELRKQYQLTLGDSLIASTALANDLILYTRNALDFAKIKGLKCVNPIR